MEKMNNGLKADMEDMKNGLKAYMEDMKNGLNTYVEGLKEDVTNFPQEVIPSGENVVDETHDDKKINFNHDLIDSTIGFKTHHIPNMDMRKFDGKDPVTWILHMEEYFDLHNVKKIRKVYIGAL